MTGSGKTAAFAPPLLDRLNPRDFGTQALVLCSTRELASQVAGEIRRLARYQPNIKVVTLCGGQAIGPRSVRWPTGRTWWWAHRAPEGPSSRTPWTSVG